MKQGTYVNIYVLMACASHIKKNKNDLAGIDELIQKACAGCDTYCQKAVSHKPELTIEEVQQLFA